MSGSKETDAEETAEELRRRLIHLLAQQDLENHYKVYQDLAEEDVAEKKERQERVFVIDTEATKADGEKVTGTTSDELAEIANQVLDRHEIEADLSEVDFSNWSEVVSTINDLIGNDVLQIRSATTKLNTPYKEMRSGYEKSKETNEQVEQELKDKLKEEDKQESIEKYIEILESLQEVQENLESLISKNTYKIIEKSKTEEDNFN